MFELFVAANLIHFEPAIPLSSLMTFRLSNPLPRQVDDTHCLHTYQFNRCASSMCRKMIKRHWLLYSNKAELASLSNGMDPALQPNGLALPSGIRK